MGLSINNVSMDYFLRGVDAAKPSSSAKASTKGVDGKMIKEAFQKLVDDGVLSEASLELLEQAAGKATTTLKALNKFTGQQLATAFSKKGSLDASSKVGKVIKAAVDKSQGRGGKPHGSRTPRVRQRGELR